MAALFFMWAFISAIPNANSTIKMLAFALLAFNPQLIGINSQATNDTFLILFCAAAIYYTYIFLKKHEVIIFLLTVLFSVLAVLTKSNGWVTVIAIAITLFINSFARKPWRAKELIYAVLYLFFIPFLSVINPLAQYIYNYHTYGSPIVVNSEKLAPLPFINETYIPYLGITSIQEGFLTFKLMKLIETPVIDVRRSVSEATHYNSVWTCVYASSHSAHFEDWPPSWRSRSETVFTINRGIFVFALVPTLLIIMGAIMETFATLRALFTRNTIKLEDTSFGLFSLLIIGHLLFIAIYAAEYQIYIFFKAIFIYPGLLAFSAMFIKAGTLITLYSKNEQRLIPWWTGLTGILVLLYILDVGSLIIQLLPNQFGLSILIERLSHIW